MRRTSLLLSAILTAATSGAACAGNLIVNPGAEADVGSDDGSVVSVTGWTTVGKFTVVRYGASGGTDSTSGFPRPRSPGPDERGRNFFAGGPNNQSSGAYQYIDVSGYSAAIDEGQVSFDLSGYLGGFSSQRDAARLTATFLGDAGAVLGSSSIGPVTANDRDDVTGLLFREAAGYVPIGTIQVRIDLEMRRRDGSYNDGYADDLSFRLNAVPEPAAALMLGIGVGTCMLAARRRRRRP
ncbi:hypothetical protein OJF2_01540 [Aquisphaera giovannonii]|uniref:PEP-CTERM protein-sorting domain-containing protein n=1 Tax=Aquisphaera giovannonii TaxID=406548 RepID=A0A5B9VUC0_9BACT|nr:PEP-CTERM sorting domain-containing protein [Aquisphaera giovannonii]QEH31689.1 hypothetical protein OJF2_01540 [Aquisphaera giovannonii]